MIKYNSDFDTEKYILDTNSINSNNSLDIKTYVLFFGR